MNSFLIASLIFLSRGIQAVDAGNLRPTVSIVWPNPSDSLADGTVVKIKAAAHDPDGQIKQIQFYVGDQLIGTVTEPPFNLVWNVNSSLSYGKLVLKAVATDDIGLVGESQLIPVNYSSTAPIEPVVAIVGPPQGTIIPLGRSLAFSAEVLASLGDSGPVEFFVGTNSVGILTQPGRLQATNPPMTILVTNLNEGEHSLTVRYRGGGGSYCTCNWKTNTLRVAKLGINATTLLTDGRVQVQIVTALPLKPTQIEASGDFRLWSVVGTVVPTNGYFDVTFPIVPGEAKRWYRLVISDP